MTNREVLEGMFHYWEEHFLDPDYCPDAQWNTQQRSVEYGQVKGLNLALFLMDFIDKDTYHENCKTFQELAVSYNVLRTVSTNGLQ